VKLLPGLSRPTLPRPQKFGLVNNGFVARGGIGWFTRQVFTRTAVDQLPAHLEQQYGIEVAQVTALDAGVYRVARTGGADWVARVFPAARPVSAAEGDTRVLRALAQGGFPAERCAAESPVSVLDGQAVLVTEFVAGMRPRGNGRTYAILGALLGRLHARPGDGLPPGGGWHHLALSGTPADEIATARSLLAELESAAGARDADGFAVLDEALEAAAATTVGLPEAFVHPDFVPVNALTPADDLDAHPTIVDWANAGRGPRVWSLGFVLWAAGARDLRLVDAFMSRYRRHVSLTEAELAALPVAIAARPLTMSIWSLAVGRGQAGQAGSDHHAVARQAQEIASRTRRAFDAD
jgi:Ser/Thr protein kinase RdoA (MazF antagonist)